MEPSMPAKVVCDALNIAIGQRQPGRGLIAHLGRGRRVRKQVRSETAVEAWLPVHNESGKGNCWDDALAERFSQASKWNASGNDDMLNMADIADYIVGFYNCKCLNSALDILSPAVYERQVVPQCIVVSEIT
jgi:putative transposase